MIFAKISLAHPTPSNPGTLLNSTTKVQKNVKRDILSRNRVAAKNIASNSRRFEKNGSIWGSLGMPGPSFKGHIALSAVCQVFYCHPFCRSINYIGYTTSSERISSSSATCWPILKEVTRKLGHRCASLSCITWISCITYITCITCTTDMTHQLIPWDISNIAGILDKYYLYPKHISPTN